MVKIFAETLYPTENTGWPPKEHVATSWSIGMTGNQVGTQFIYEHEWRSRQWEKGFRLRPKYRKHLKEYRANKAGDGD